MYTGWEINGEDVFVPCLRVAPDEEIVVDVDGCFICALLMGVVVEKKIGSLRFASRT